MAADDIASAIREIQQRVRARYPDGTAGSASVPLPDLMPIVHARDAAESKVAAIGTVNPRRGGLLNSVAQKVKRLVARGLDWHIREQVEFNRGVMACVEATLGALNDYKLTAQNLAAQQQAAMKEIEAKLQGIANSAARLSDEAKELKDVRDHWSQWRQEWERKLSVNEVQFLRSVADLQAASTHRATVMEGNFRDIVSSQHRDFTGALERSIGRRCKSACGMTLRAFAKNMNA